jgi:hypothetical protein
MSETNSTTIHGVVYRVIERFIGYRFGDDGSVWSQWRQGLSPSVTGNEWRKLRCTIDQGGYVAFRIPKYKRTFRVHRLILEAFRGPCPEGTEARHVNGVRSDNRLANLVWATPKENNADKICHGTSPHGERNPNSKLTQVDVLSIWLDLEAGEKHRDLAAKYGVSRSNITMIKNRRQWTHVTNLISKEIWFNALFT